MKKHSGFDELTGLKNRRQIQALINEAIIDSNTTQLPLTAAIIGIEQFKQINQKYGHSHGDAVLQEVADMLSAHFDNDEAIGRWGDSEFLVLFPNHSREFAIKSCSQLQQQVANHHCAIPFDASVRFGAAQYQSGENPQSLLTRAEKALYLGGEEQTAGTNPVQPAAASINTIANSKPAV
jgi:diguanylate cyclase (GGDEF)-like protein